MYICLVFLVIPSLVYLFPDGYSIEYFREFFSAFSKDVPAIHEIPASKRCKDCPQVYYPVCADDNATYINECRMRCYNENKNPGPKANFVRTGPCEVFPDLD